MSLTIIRFDGIPPLQAPGSRLQGGLLFASREVDISNSSTARVVFILLTIFSKNTIGPSTTVTIVSHQFVLLVIGLSGISLASCRSKVNGTLVLVNARVYCLRNQCAVFPVWVEPACPGRAKSHQASARVPARKAVFKTAFLFEIGACNLAHYTFRKMDAHGPRRLRRPEFRGIPCTFAARAAGLLLRSGRLRIGWAPTVFPDQSSGIRIFWPG